MSANSPCGSEFPRSCAAVHSDLFADDEAVGDEFTDGLTGVGIRDFVHFIGIKPDFALAAPRNGGGKALLRTEVNPRRSKMCQLMDCSEAGWAG